MEGIQTVLVVVIVALTLLLVVVGVQVIMVIADTRRALKRLNTLLEDSIWGGGLLRPDKLTGIVEMVRKRKRLHEKENGTIQNDKVRNKKV